MHACPARLDRPPHGVLRVRTCYPLVYRTVRFASSVPPPAEGRNYSYADYGGGGLFWPFGGAGFFVSGGVVDVIGGEGGFRRCVEMFGHMNTDVQVGGAISSSR